MRRCGCAADRWFQLWSTSGELLQELVSLVAWLVGGVLHENIMSAQFVMSFLASSSRLLQEKEGRWGVWDFIDLHSCIFETFMEVQRTTKWAIETRFLN